MIHLPQSPPSAPRETTAPQPVASGEQYLGRNASAKRRLWERLNPRHRKTLQLLARALVLRQEQARLPDDLRAKLLAALDDLERLASRLERLLAAVSGKAPLGR